MEKITISFWRKQESVGKLENPQMAENYFLSTLCMEKDMNSGSKNQTGIWKLEIFQIDVVNFYNTES